MTPRQTDERAVPVELHAVHQTAHEKYSKSAAALFDRRVIALTFQRKALTVIADFDRQFVFRERTAHRESVRSPGSPVFDGIAERFTGGKTDIGDLFHRKPTDTREARNGVAREWYVFTIAAECGAVSGAHVRSLVPDTL